MDGQPQLNLHVLGELTATRDGAVVDLGGRRQRAVLAGLVISRDQVVPADRLVDCVWGDRPPANANGALQAYVSHLRRRLEPDAGARQRDGVIARAGPGYVLRLAPDAVDAWEFEAAVEAAAGHGARGRGVHAGARAAAVAGTGVRRLRRRAVGRGGDRPAHRAARGRPRTPARDAPRARRGPARHRRPRGAGQGGPAARGALAAAGARALPVAPPGRRAGGPAAGTSGARRRARRRPRSRPALPSRRRCSPSRRTSTGRGPQRPRHRPRTGDAGPTTPHPRRARRPRPRDGPPAGRGSTTWPTGPPAACWSRAPPASARPACSTSCAGSPSPPACGCGRRGAARWSRASTWGVVRQLFGAGVGRRAASRRALRRAPRPLRGDDAARGGRLRSCSASTTSSGATRRRCSSSPTWSGASRDFPCWSSWRCAPASRSRPTTCWPSWPRDETVTVVRPDAAHRAGHRRAGDRPARSRRRRVRRHLPPDDLGQPAAPAPAAARAGRPGRPAGRGPRRHGPGGGVAGDHLARHAPPAPHAGDGHDRRARGRRARPRRRPGGGRRPRAAPGGGRRGRPRRPGPQRDPASTATRSTSSTRWCATRSTPTSRPASGRCCTSG